MNISDTEMSSIVLSNVVKNKVYANKVIHDLDVEFFVDHTEKAVLNTIKSLHIKYNQVPTVDEIVATMKETTNVHNLDKNVITDVLGDNLTVENQDWLVDHTERFIKRRRTMMAFERTFAEYESNDIDVDHFYKEFQNASSFSFDTDIGHSLVRDASIRYDMYSAKEAKQRFYIEMLDYVTGGGMDKKGTLNVALAGTNAGKSLFMGDVASKSAMNGDKVLVISMEMAEIKLTERIECNLMNVPISEFRDLPQDEFNLKQSAYLEEMRLKGGDIFFKQFPTRGAHAGDFRNLLIDYKNKLDVEFDLVVIDYLNICACMSGGRNDNSYTEVKKIAEELRALAVEFQLPILTATQTNRAGQDATDLSLDNVSESAGLAHTADFFIALIGTDEWDEQNKLQIKQLKSRYGNKNFYNKFFIGRDLKYMRLFNLDISVNNQITENKSKSTESVSHDLPDSTTVDVSIFDVSVLGNK